MAGTMLMRAGLAYAGQKAGSYFAKPSAGEATDDVEAS
jgi:hypothetical protein